MKFGEVKRIGVECIGTYGAGLLRYLQQFDIEILEVTAPDKTGLIHRRAPWKSEAAVELATLEWVFWFNHQHLLGSIGNTPPVEAEQRYYQQLKMSQKQTVLLWPISLLYSRDKTYCHNHISQQIISTDSFNQVASLRTISSSTLCNQDSDRCTMLIRGQVYFGVEPSLSSSYPDCHLWPHWHVSESCSGWHPSPAIHNQYQ